MIKSVCLPRYRIRQTDRITWMLGHWSINLNRQIIIPKKVGLVSDDNIRTIRLSDPIKPFFAHVTIYTLDIHIYSCIQFPRRPPCFFFFFAARCKHLPKIPENGMVIAPRMDHGTRARFQCYDGYELIGNHTTECRYGNWSSEMPACVESEPFSLSKCLRCIVERSI